MNLSQQTIEIHFKEIMALVEQLRLLSKEVEKIGQEGIFHTAFETKRGWESVCADKLVERELKLGQQIGREGEGLYMIAEEMKEQAEEMYRMETLNVSLASNRIY